MHDLVCFALCHNFLVRNCPSLSLTVDDLVIPPFGLKIVRTA